MKWITYKNVGIDRIACAWLIKKYIDSEAIFDFIEHGAKANERNVNYFDIPNCKYSHRRGRCTFSTLLKEFSLTDPILAKVAKIIDGADCANDIVVEPESYGLEAICDGIRRISSDDLVAFENGRIIYDALYAYIKNEENVK